MLFRLPSYGPEMRGGTANVSVIISDERISSPIINQFDTAIILNQQSLDKFEKSVKPGGLLIYDPNGITEHPTRKDIYVKVQFAGFTESSPKAQTSAPTTPVVNKNTGNADYAVCAKTAMEGVANNSCRNRVEQLVRYNQQRGAISEARYGSRHTECSSDGRCVVNIPVKMADGSEKYAFACCKLSVPSSFDVCEVSSNRVLFKTSEGSSTSVTKVDISNRRITPGDC